MMYAPYIPLSYDGTDTEISRTFNAEWFSQLHMKDYDTVETIHEKIQILSHNAKLCVIEHNPKCLYNLENPHEGILLEYIKQTWDIHSYSRMTSTYGYRSLNFYKEVEKMKGRFGDMKTLGEYDKQFNDICRSLGFTAYEFLTYDIYPQHHTIGNQSVLVDQLFWFPAPILLMKNWHKNYKAIDITLRDCLNKEMFEIFSEQVYQLFKQLVTSDTPLPECKQIEALEMAIKLNGFKAFYNTIVNNGEKSEWFHKELNRLKVLHGITS